MFKSKKQTLKTLLDLYIHVKSNSGLCNVRVKLLSPSSVKCFQGAWNSAGQCTLQDNWHTSVALGLVMLSLLLGSGLIPV